MDESGLSQRPHRARSRAPRSQTPVFEYSFNRKTLSAVAGIAFWNVCFQLHPGSVRAAQVAEFQHAREGQIRKPPLVIRDELATHRSRLVRHYIEASRGRIAVEILPAYAPELNPVEYLWGYWKQHEPAHVCRANTDGRGRCRGWR